jgi:hypothetical protein
VGGLLSNRFCSIRCPLEMNLPALAGLVVFESVVEGRRHGVYSSLLPPWLVWSVVSPISSPSLL